MGKHHFAKPFWNVPLAFTLTCPPGNAMQQTLIGQDKELGSWLRTLPVSSAS